MKTILTVILMQLLFLNLATAQSEGLPKKEVAEEAPSAPTDLKTEMKNLKKLRGDVVKLIRADSFGDEFVLALDQMMEAFLVSKTFVPQKISDLTDEVAKKEMLESYLVAVDQSLAVLQEMKDLSLKAKDPANEITDLAALELKLFKELGAIQKEAHKLFK